jgi:hypothetical protein
MSRTAPTATDYSVFGLRVRSELPLPELFPASGSGDPDVVIRLGTIDEPPSRRIVEVVEDGLLFAIREAGRYRAANGREIVIDPIPGIPDRNVRLYLLGSVFGALLHQRGLLPLHANAIQIDGKAVAFMGESGSGKSTLGAWFHDRGFPIIADDVCVVRFDADGRAMALPGLPRLRLWQEALEASGRDAGDFGRSYVGDDTWNKFDVPIGADTAAAAACVLGAVYVLEKGAAVDIRRLEGVEAAEAMFAHTYRGAYVSALKEQQGHWSAVMRLVRHTPVYRLTRGWGLDRMDQEGAQVLDHIRQASAPRDQAAAT